MLHGDIHWAKSDALTRRASFRKTMIENLPALMLDTEAVSFLEKSLYMEHALLVNAMRGGMGHGKVLNLRRSLPKRTQMLRELSAASPAKAAELRHTEKRETDFAQALVRMRDREREYRRRHRHLNWGFYHGRGV
jgi:hypothetical protein